MSEIVYEANVKNYEPLRYFVNGEEVISKYYKINVKKGSFINKSYRIIQPKQVHNGYIVWNLNFKDEPKFNMLSHRIIYAHVYGDIPEALVIDHIDLVSTATYLTT
jgi:hypothetical protein